MRSASWNAGGGSWQGGENGGRAKKWARRMRAAYIRAKTPLESGNPSFFRGPGPYRIAGLGQIVIL
jgi:hypothetical protein